MIALCSLRFTEFVSSLITFWFLLDYAFEHSPPRSRSSGHCILTANGKSCWKQSALNRVHQVPVSLFLTHPAACTGPYHCRRKILPRPERSWLSAGSFSTGPTGEASYRAQGNSNTEPHRTTVIVCSICVSRCVVSSAQKLGKELRTHKEHTIPSQRGIENAFYSALLPTREGDPLGNNLSHL